VGVDDNSIQAISRPKSINLVRGNADMFYVNQMDRVNSGMSPCHAMSLSWEQNHKHFIDYYYYYWYCHCCCYYCLPCTNDGGYYGQYVILHSVCGTLPDTRREPGSIGRSRARRLQYPTTTYCKVHTR